MTGATARRAAAPSGSRIFGFLHSVIAQPGFLARVELCPDEGGILRRERRVAGRLERPFPGPSPPRLDGAELLVARQLVAFRDKPHEAFGVLCQILVAHHETIGKARLE